MLLALLQRASETFNSATPDDHGEETFRMTRCRSLTLLDVIQAVSEEVVSDQETLIAVADLINSGQVRLCGDLAGATIDLSIAAEASA
jgi:hypothetical protein